MSVMLNFWAYMYFITSAKAMIKRVFLFSVSKHVEFLRSVGPWKNPTWRQCVFQKFSELRSFHIHDMWRRENMTTQQKIASHSNFVKLRTIYAYYKDVWRYFCFFFIFLMCGFILQEMYEMYKFLITQISNFSYL